MLVSACAGAAFAVPEVPALGGRVNDLAGLLSRDEARALTARLAAFEEETSHQIVVLTVPSLQGEAVEAFAIRVAEAWKVGHAGLDNGVIVVIAARDRRARIEVGYGLEGAIPDALAARILREQMIPYFQAGSMPDGIRAGVDALIAAARGEEIPATKRPSRSPRDSPDGLLARALFVGMLAGSLGGLVGRKRPWAGIGVGGTLAAVATYALTGWIVAAAVSAVLASMLGAGGVGWFEASSYRGYRGGHHRGGFGGGFGGGGGGFGGGGFGGGGGGFGGGGASGSW